MDNEINQSINNEPDEENGSYATEPQNEEIPLWLQGLEETGEGEQDTLDQKEQREGESLSEIIEEPGEQFPPLDFDQLKDENKDLPEWLNEFSHEEPEVQDQPSNQDFHEIELGSDDKAVLPEEIIEEGEEEDNGFIEIEMPLEPGDKATGDLTSEKIQESKVDEFELETQDKNIPPTDFDLESLSVDKELTQNEELPSWLQEIIDEPTEIVSEAAFVDEAIEIVSEEISIDEEIIIENVDSAQDEAIMIAARDQSIDESGNIETEDQRPDQAAETGGEDQFIDDGFEIATEDKSFYEGPEISEEETFTDHDMESPIDDSTKPVPISDEGLPLDELALEDERLDTLHSILSSQDLPVDDEEWLMEEFIPTDSVMEEQEFEDQLAELIGSSQTKPSPVIPQELLDVNDLFKHGFHSKAMDIISRYLMEPAYLDQVESTLENAVKTTSEESSEAWEMLGDVGIKQGHHKQALKAYTKSLEILLKSKGR